MSRPRRPDVEPEILIRDDRYQRQVANDAVDNGWHVKKVRRRGDQPVKDGFMLIMDETQRQLRAAKRNGAKLDEGLVAFMMENCAQAQVAPILDDNGNELVRDGFRVCRLVRVGCRVYMTQQQIADLFGCGRQHVGNQISLMKQYALIVNKGQGWYEFAAVLCWRGDLDIQASYRDQQRVRDGRVVTDGKTTHVAEDMDDDDDENEPGQAAQ